MTVLTSWFVSIDSHVRESVSRVEHSEKQTKQGFRDPRVSFFNLGGDGQTGETGKEDDYAMLLLRRRVDEDETKCCAGAEVVEAIKTPIQQLTNAVKEPRS